MSDEGQPWEKREGEGRWYIRFLVYLRMGPSRSLLGAVNVARKGPKKPSISAPGAWKDAAKRWEWKERAQAYDEEQERLALAECRFARVSERAKVLDRWIGTQDAIMLASVEEVGYARADAMEQLRGLLDDMAKETGGRVKLTKQEHSGSIDVSGYKELLLERLARLEVERLARLEGTPDET